MPASKEAFRSFGRMGYTSAQPIMKRHVLIFGLVGGLLIAALQYTEYRFVIIEKLDRAI